MATKTPAANDYYATRRPVEVLPAYTMDGPLHDEITGCVGRILGCSWHGGHAYLDLEIGGREYNVIASRTRPLR